jgi:ATP-binding cassette subfamily F protein 3
MLKIQNIDFSIAGKPLFQNASATVPTGKKVGVVGRNGTGKTTLLRLIRGELPLDGGSIEVPRGHRIGGVAQEAPSEPTALIEIVMSADEEAAALEAESHTTTDAHRIAEIQTRLADIGAHSAEARASAILNGLGFNAAAQKRGADEFSGGWRMRVALASTLFAQPDLLLLDEPTNYLDLEGSVWLEGFLAKYPATALIISHDRDLLNKSVEQILHLEHRKLTLYGGRYDQFEEERRLMLERHAASKRKQDAQRAHIQSFVDRFRYKASKARQAQARIKMLERMQPIAALTENAVAEFNFPSPEELSPPLLSFEDVSVGYDGKPVLRHLGLRIDQDDRIALLGANGEGKSTLSKLICGRLPPLSGRIQKSSKLRFGYFAQHQMDELRPNETPIQHIARLRPGMTPGKHRALLAAGGIGAEQAEMQVDRLSGGQKARLLMRLTALDAPHMLVLDEPTNHLDIESREALVQALSEYEGAVILVSHDAHLVESVADRLWLVKDGAVAEFTGDIDDYRKLLLAERGGGNGKSGPKPATKEKQARREANRANRAVLRAEVAKCEDRVAKLEEMRTRIDLRLAAPKLYGEGDPAKIEALQIKRAEIVDGLARAEGLWLDAQEKLDAAGG